MDNQKEKILVKADMKSGSTPAKIIAFVYYINVIPTFFGTFYTYFSEDYGYYGYDILWLTFLALITIVALGLPIAIFLINKYIAKNCTLELTDKQIYGSCKKLFSTKKLQMPIEKLDNIMTTSSLMDKLRGGETILVHSNSGFIKFHYVHNANEFVQATLKKIEEVKQTGEKLSNPVQSNGDTSFEEKLQSLSRLKEQGILSNEEFEEKKKDLIGKL